MLTKNWKQIKFLTKKCGKNDGKYDYKICDKNCHKKHGSCKNYWKHVNKRKKMTENVTKIFEDEMWQKSFSKVGQRMPAWKKNVWWYKLV